MNKVIKRRNLTLGICVIIIFLIIIFTSILILNKIEYDRNNIDVSNAIHGVIVENDVSFYKSPKISKWKLIRKVSLGENAYIVDDFQDKDGIEWYKVKINNKVGYVQKKNVSYFKYLKKTENVLMSDVSKFNVIYDHFKSAGEYEAFILNSNINYVYIRAGGRGYGVEGNMYLDPNYQMYIDACEYLQIPYGFYYIDEAITSEEIEEEVEFMKDFLNKNQRKYCVLPLAIDVENHDGVGRADKIWEQRADLLTELIEKFNEVEIDTIVYSNAKLANKYLYEIDTNFWIAYYNLEGKVPNYWYTDTDQEAAQNDKFTNKIIGWQFTEKGIDTNPDYPVDLSLVSNSFFIKYTKDIMGEK